MRSRLYVILCHTPLASMSHEGSFLAKVVLLKLPKVMVMSVWLDSKLVVAGAQSATSAGTAESRRVAIPGVHEVYTFAVVSSSAARLDHHGASACQEPRSLLAFGLARCPFDQRSLARSVRCLSWPWSQRKDSNGLHSLRLASCLICGPLEQSQADLHRGDRFRSIHCSPSHMALWPCPRCSSRFSHRALSPVLQCLAMSCNVLQCLSGLVLALHGPKFSTLKASESKEGHGKRPVDDPFTDNQA